MMQGGGHHVVGASAAGAARAQAALHALRERPPRAVAIGGSAGAFDALRTLLPALPREISVPLLVVMHVAAETRNVWGAVFESSELMVREAEDKDVVEAGSVYVAPPNYHMLVDRSGRLQLSVDPRVHFARPSIDVLFESVAWAYGQDVLGIVLSGANADGAAGLAAIARAGGHAWIQAPETAMSALMPRAALEAVPAAHALGLSEMADVLRSWVLSR